LVIIAFFVTGRFRVPLVPLLAVGAAVALVTCFDFVRSRRLFHAVSLLAVACVVAGVLSVDYFSVRKATSGFAEYTDALDALESGDTDGAIAGLEAVRRGQSVRAPELYLALARAYVKRGRTGDNAAVLEVAEEGLRHFPDEAELLWYAALGNLVARDTEAAKKHAERYIALKPGDVRALRLAFSVAMAQGRTADARALLSRAEEIDSQSPLIELMRRELALAAP
jgi:Flp pilus assembly protein TadD